MDDFQKKFLEEASDLLNDLEEALLELENHPDDPAQIERVFRAMHSLKGGGGMFGFDRVSEFTHNLENIYDLVRNNKLKINSDLLSVTLASVDHLKILLDSDELTGSAAKEHELLTSQIKKLAGDTSLDEVEVNEKEFPLQDEIEKDRINTYLIYFNPILRIFNDGTNPLLLVDELTQCGHYKIFTKISDIPALSEFEPEDCYISWQVILATEKSENELNDIFIFLDEDSELEIHYLENGNLLFNPSFVELIEKHAAEKEVLDTKYVKEIARHIKPLEKEETTKSTIVKKDTKENTAISSIRVSSDKIDQLMNLVSELVTTQASLSLYAEDTKMHELVVISENVENLTRQLRDIAFSISLIPIDSMLTRFHRLVRDLSTEFNKEISFEVEGGETELDKTLVQNLTEPLMHIIRNSIDHGIEPLEIREKLGKPRKGLITLKAYYSGANVIITIHDDGKGIDPKMIREKAIIKGLVTSEASHTEKEYLNMIFLPGLSTAQVITDISGRGVGMDVVKRKINEVRGEVDIESDYGIGTTVTIKLPLTLSIIDGLLVRIHKTHYVIPLSVVDKIYEVKHDTVVGSFNNLIVLDGKQFPYYYLREEFEDTEECPEQEQIILVHYEDTRIGLTVDYVVGEYQAVLKPLGRHYRNHEIISGATILGDGTVALVLDTNKIIKQFSYSSMNEIIDNADLAFQESEKK